MLVKIKHSIGKICFLTIIFLCSTSYIYCMKNIHSEPGNIKLMLKNIKEGKSIEDNAIRIVQSIRNIYKTLSEKDRMELQIMLKSITKYENYENQLYELQSKLEKVDSFTLEVLEIDIAPWLDSYQGLIQWNILSLENQPSSRWGHIQVYDSERKVLTIFGGSDSKNNGYIYFNDTWQANLDESRWIQIHPDDQPSPRDGASAILDSQNDRILLYGGFYWDGDDRHYYNDLWEFDLEYLQWNPLNPNGIYPSVTCYASLIFDVLNNQLILFGGMNNNNQNENSTWALNLNNLEWQYVDTEGTHPYKRSGHSAIYNQKDHSMIVFGGNDSIYKNDLWELDLQNLKWKEIVTNSPKPKERSGMALIMDSITNHRLVMFGGEGLYVPPPPMNPTSLPLNDLWVFDFSKKEWLKIGFDDNDPSLRSWITGSYDSKQGKMFVFGGKRGDNGLNDTYEFVLPFDWVIPDPLLMKQGDIVHFKLFVNDIDNLDFINYKINEIESSTVSLPHTVSYNTCKDNGNYYTTIVASVEAHYNSGSIITKNYEYDLTVGSTYREDDDLDYSILVAVDNEARLSMYMATAFMNEFDSYRRSGYEAAHPYYYTHEVDLFVNDVDLSISIGHGKHHQFRAGNSDDHIVDLSTTSYGSFSPCYKTGDLEYLVFASCYTLSMDNYLNNDFWYYWIHDESTKLYERPFTGLHMVMGFHTDFVVTDVKVSVNGYYYWWSNGDDFFKSFARKLDNGWRVKDAWLYAIDDELYFFNGNNRGAVIYGEPYRNDILFTSKDDYIYGNDHYIRFWVEYWD